MKTKIYGDNGDFECKSCTAFGCEYKFMNPPFTCSNCGNEISRRQYIDTKREYSFALCPECQYEIEKKLKTENSILTRAREYVSCVCAGLVEVIKHGRK